MHILKFNFKPTIFTINGKHHQIKSNYVDLVLSYIVNRMLSTTHLQNGYVEIPSKSFRTIYDKYWVYIGYLIEKGIIERKPYSITNHTCYGYRFCYLFIRNLQITQVVLNQPVDTKNEYKEIPIEDQSVVDFKIIQRLKSDFQHAEVDLLNIDKVRIKNSAYVDIKKYFYNVIQLHKWKVGNEHSYFEWKSNRLYTNFTFLSSHYRKKNVKLNGESIVEFDISSSFPLMLAIYCIKVNPGIVNDYDFKKYCTSIKQKTFYEDLTDALNITKDCDSMKVKIDNNGNEISNRKFTKDIVKSLFQIFINGDSGRTPYVEGYSNSFIKEQFALKYPCIYEIIEDLKSTNQQIYYKLSKIESEFIVDIIQDLYKRFPKIKILTCHDAIYIPFSYLNKGKKVWDKHMISLLKQLPDTIEKSPIKIKFLEQIGIYEDVDKPLVKKRNFF